MAVIPTSDKENLLVRLGYASDTEDYQDALDHLASDFSDATVARVTEILNELANIDTLLSQARSESMADGTRRVSLNYGRHIKHLRLDGWEYLKELGYMLGVEVRNSRYGWPRRGYATQYQ